MASLDPDVRGDVRSYDRGVVHGTRALVARRLAVRVGQDGAVPAREPRLVAPPVRPVVPVGQDDPR
eukprot:6202633-Pyramimonas_sp.AAC.1